ncbi:sugar phosphate isomerase/epimerase family protein [Zobellia galactanivorans]|uniref:sugar phosphate isomerase/epimerase family protein n=1 Tax=Zobellia galactanivorans (strain DSM 12802 / CCUG 47099 / CIP 106680 / NCIMB 13871 / Dsij) TaxID=63186 RepID=UPI001C07D87E|nr:sugar phosphate isomerase/epimerase family protein [Zobellia galactanivorans]MBU3026252.1 sugar phosphate isomerase/epimerase [Zobellia galactanivorans]
MKANRRNFLKRTSAGVLGIGALSFPEMSRAAMAEETMENMMAELKLGVASYTLREFTREKALDMTLRCGLNRITFKSMHLPLDSGAHTIREAVAQCKKKGVVLYGAGVVYMKTKAEVDQAFEYAKTAELDMIVGVPSHDLLDYVEEKVKSYNIKLAIHNHGPGDKVYPSAESAYVKIKDRDKRMGLCIDIGHTQRIKRDPSQDLTQFFDRVFDIHLKDVTASEHDGQTCIIGRGVIDFPAFLKTVLKLGYQGTLALEYEAEGNDPLPGMMESIGYVKGILSTL